MNTSFENVDLQNINPDLVLNEQTDLLPFAQQFEFSREKLELGKQIGSGAFGIVLKGTAYGIRSHEPKTIVAVKMLRQMADNEVRSILSSSLK